MGRAASGLARLKSSEVFLTAGHERRWESLHGWASPTTPPLPHEVVKLSNQAAHANNLTTDT